MTTNDDYGQLSHQQQRFCDEYLMHFNAFKAAVNAGYSENTARKGELLHLPKVQLYLQDAMKRTSGRLQITHDMILSELSKIAFSNMGNYYDEYAVLKPMNKLTNDEKAAICQYQILDAVDDHGHRIGELSKIKLHNKMSALDKIARHLNFYGSVGGEKQESRSKNQDEEEQKQESRGKNQDVGGAKSKEQGVMMVDKEQMQAEGGATLTELNVLSRGCGAMAGNDGAGDGVENILTLPPLGKKSEEARSRSQDGVDWLSALGIGADTVRQLTDNACAV